MNVAFLGPFDNQYLRPFLPNLTDDDLHQAPGMGGYGLIPTVIQRVKGGERTALVTLDTHLEGQILKRSCGNFTLYACPRRPLKAVRDMFVKEVRFIGEALEDASPELIHANWTYEYAVAALRVLPEIPVLVTARDHTLDILRYTGRQYLAPFLITVWVYRKAEYLSAVSPHVQKLASRLSGNQVRMITNPLIRNGLSVIQGPASGSVDRKMVLSATVWNKLKNPKNGLRAFKLVRRKFPEVELHLCGDGMEDGGEAQRWARKNGLDGGVVFYGKVNHEKLMAMMETAYLYLHTSLTEACNTAIAEAMSIGVPVVGGVSSGGVPWQLNYGKAGALVDVRDPRSIADTLIRLCADEAFREEMAVRGREYALATYDAGFIARQYEDLYQEIVDRRR